MPDQQDKRFTTATLVLVGLGFLLIGGVVTAVFEKPDIVGPKGPSDTPVILVGDSMKFKTGVVGSPWAQVGKTPFVSYSVGAALQPSLIVVRTNTGATDSDVLKVDVPTAAWEVDEFVAGNPTAVASITPYPSGSTTPTGLAANVVPGNTGVLCPSNSYTQLDYYPSNTGSGSNCSGTPVSFSQISILVLVNGVMQTVGTLDCEDASHTQYLCKIQFRE